MTNVSLLDQINLIQESEELAGIDVMTSLADTYVKRMMILEQCDETSDLYQEAVEGEGAPTPAPGANKQSLIDRAKNSKPAKFVVEILRIVSNILKRIPVLVKKLGLKVYGKQIYDQLKATYGDSNELPLPPSNKKTTLSNVYEILNKLTNVRDKEVDDQVELFSEYFTKIDTFVNGLKSKIVGAFGADKIDPDEYYKSLEFRGNVENVANIISLYVKTTDMLAEDAAYVNASINSIIKELSEGVEKYYNDELEKYSESYVMETSRSRYNQTLKEKEEMLKAINADLWRKGSANLLKICTMLLNDFKAYLQALSRYVKEKNGATTETP